MPWPRIELVSWLFQYQTYAKGDTSDKMIEMGYEREAIVNSVTNRAYDEIYATYMLLGMKEPEVRFPLFLPLSLFWSRRGEIRRNQTTDPRGKQTQAVVAIGRRRPSQKTLHPLFLHKSVALNQQLPGQVGKGPSARKSQSALQVNHSKMKSKLETIF